MDIRTETLSVMVKDNAMQLYTARPTENTGRDSRPGFMVLQEAFGVNHYIRALTERIAGLGFVAAAPELYHRTAPGFESGYEDKDEAMKNMKAMTDEGLAADLEATFAWLQADTEVDAHKIVASGYCMGGRAAFLANALLPLKAAVSYYGGGIAPNLLPRAKDQHGPVLLFWGGRDKHIGTDQPRQVADALLQAGKPFIDVMFADADHGFFCDERASYHGEAAGQSWALMQQFLQDNLQKI